MSNQTLVAARVWRAGADHGRAALPHGPARGRLCLLPRSADVTALTLFFLAVVVVALAASVWVMRRGSRHRHALSRLLDSADAFEARLRTARSEIEAVTGEEDASVRTALHEMLRQRLWLQQHGEAASLHQLNEMRASIDAARIRIEQQLAQIERARAAAP